MITNRRTTLFAAIGAAAFVAPIVQPALGDPIVYYSPPRMVKQGKTTVTIAGDGKVVVKVLVNADGTFKVQSVLTSTNHADDGAALDIAKNSVYAPATRGSQKVLAFYDYTLVFKSGGAASGDEASGGELGEVERQLKAANYSGAQTNLKTYLAAHPTDTRAELDLGVADTFLGAYDDASAAFDKGAPVPAADQAVAAKAYVERAVGLLNAKNYPDGLAAAKHAVDFSATFASEDTLGYAEMESGDDAASLTDLEKAHAMAKGDANVSTSSRVANDVHLVQAYYAAGSADKAQQIAAEAAALDPKAAVTTAHVTAAYYAGKAADANKAGKLADSAALYIQAAATDPTQAAVLYVNASFAFLKMKPPDDVKAKDAADKALAANPEDASANYAEGIVLADKGDKDGAAAALTKADALAKAAGNTTLVTAIERAQKQLSTTTEQ